MTQSQGVGGDGPRSLGEKDLTARWGRRGENDGTLGEKVLQEWICWEDELVEAQTPAGGFSSHHLYPGSTFPRDFPWFSA